MDALYTVQPGDTLQSIAGIQMGDESLWQYLASINAISAPYKLSPGEKIIVEVAEVEGKINWIYVGIASAVIIAIAAYFWFKG